MSADALAVTTRPPFGLRANATTARSISPTSRVSIALNSTADEDALDLNRCELADTGGECGIPKDRRARHVGRDLFEQLQPFPADAVFERCEPGGVAARLRQARGEPCAVWIDDIREHDRHAAACLLQRRHARAGRGH